MSHSTPFPNDFGIATLSLGSWHYHSLPTRLTAASAAGFKAIDLFDEDWASYLHSQGHLKDVESDSPWSATPAALAAARELGDLVKSHGMYIACTQPLRNIEGKRDPAERKAALELVSQRFPFMRAFDTDLVFMCASMENYPAATADYKTVAADLAEMGRMAEVYSQADGGRMIRIGYEGLSWGKRNTWASSWEVVRAANRKNVGLVLDSFNILAAEYANPYNAAGHGRIYESERESLDVLRLSMASLVATVPGEKIFFVQVADAELVNPKAFPIPDDPDVPELLPWSRSHRLYPCEPEYGGYMPVETVTAAILATGYQGPLSLEVFNSSLIEPDKKVPQNHAHRGMAGLKNLVEKVKELQKYWGEPIENTKAFRLWKENAEIGLQ